MARQAVLSAQDIRGEGVFYGLETSLMTEDECKLIVRLICATISKVEEQSWSSSTASGCRYMGRHSGNGHIGLLTFLCVIVGRCSNNGLP